MGIFRRIGGFAMADIFSTLRAAGFSDIQIAHSGDSWSLLRVTSSSGLQMAQSNVLFLDSSAKWATLNDARRGLEKIALGLDYFPLVQNSAKGLPSDLARVSRELGARNQALTVRTLLLNRLIRNTNLGAVDVMEEPRFVEPTVRRRGHSDGEALGALTSWLGALDDPSQTHLGVILAGAGIGKTTLVRELYARLMGRRGAKISIPLLVESQHWARFAASSSDLDLADIWKNSFDSLYSAILSEELLEKCVNTGAITVVFDGFDELCTKLSAQFRPSATLARIREVLRENEGKILITSRQAFWDEFVEPAVKAEFEQFELLPFSRQQTERYWIQAFPSANDEPKRDRARKIHARIETQSSAPFREQLGAVPAVVALIAECADEDEPTGKYGKYLEEERPLDGLIKYMCAREQARRLPSANPDDQVSWLTDLALDFGDHFPLAELKSYAEIELGLQPPELNAVSSHALLRGQTDPKSAYYALRFDFLGDYLLARWAASEITGQRKNPTDRFIRLLARNASGSSQFIDYLSIELNSDDKLQALSDMFIGLQGKKDGYETGEARSALFHIALGSVERSSPSGPKDERTAALLKMLEFGRYNVNSLGIRGNISGLDFGGVVFKDCTFRDVRLSRCVFDSKTKFLACKFDGRLEVDDPASLGQAEFDDACQFSSTAFETVQQALGAKKIPMTDVLVLETFHSALTKFKRGLSFKKVDPEYLRTGPLGRSPFREDVLDALRRNGVIRFHDVGSPMESVRIPSESMPEVQRFLDNRLVVGRIASAVNEVKARVMPEKKKGAPS
jgi:hypothetical protein